MPRRLFILLLTALLCGVGCTPIRTVYDAQGNEIKQDDSPGGEKDLMTTFEKRFEESFKVTKTKDGVPQTTSNKVSSFQRYLDASRRDETTFETGSFDTGKTLNLKDKNFGDSSRRVLTGKDGIEKKTNSMFSTDLRPDFMNESRGLSYTRRYLTPSESASRLQGDMARDSGQPFYLGESTTAYQTDKESSYIETRRNKREAPTIIPYREYYRKNRMKGTDLLQREPKAE